MKRISLLVYLSFSILALVAQNQHDAIWLFGSPRLLPTDTHFGGSRLDFRSGVPEASYFELDIFLDPTAIICDENGELVFYTNGCKIMNAQHEIMENGDTINTGIRHEQYCDFSYPSIQGIMALPKPGNQSTFGLFHSTIDDNSFLFTELRYTEIDVAANYDQGEVILKDLPILTDTISSLISAVRHANGRDWWIVCGKENQNSFFVTYYGPNGPGNTISIALEDTIGTSTDIWQTAFSPDGNAYAVANRYHGVRLYQFDRCSGTFSNWERLRFDNDTLSAIGVSFSPSNQFLYVGAGEKLFQYDLSQGNIPESRQFIAEYDGYLVSGVESLRTTFGQLMPGPNGKIYGTAPNTSNVLHIVHSPDEPGMASSVEQHGLLLPTLHSFRPPNFPYFRLWDIPGSPCDTLGIDTPTDLEDITTKHPKFQLFPNPTSSLATINFEQSTSGMLQLFDVSGQLLSKTRLEYATQYELAVDQYAPGLYLISFQPDDGVLQWGKLIIQ